MKKLVKFENGKYGIRNGNWLTGYYFLDFKHPIYYWKMESEWFNNCQTTLQEAERYLKPLKSQTYKVINNKKMNYEDFNNELESEMEAALKSENFNEVEALNFKLGYLKQALYFEQNK